MKATQGAGPGDTAGQWARVIWLDQQIRSGCSPSIADLQEEFGIGRRTAFNTIAYLRDSLGAPLKCRPGKGYCYSDPAYGLPAVFLGEGEILAILLAQQLTRQYLGTPLEEPLRQAVRKISRYLPREAQVRLDEVAHYFHFSGGTGLEVPVQLMADVHRAIRERRLLHLRYHTLHRDEETEREVEPHFLTNARGDWLLVAWDRLRDQDRTFMLTRVRDWQLRETRFKPRPELRPELYSRDTFLTEHGAHVQDVVLRFEPYQARWIKERQWHASQKVEERPDGSVILRLQVSGEGDLLRWVLAYGSQVEVLEPASLRERVVEEARRMLDRYEPGFPDAPEPAAKKDSQPR
jgi:predicted DNA-binding transcriptional regulator YafY